MLDVKVDLVKKSLSLLQLHWTTQKSKILAQKSFFERQVLMYSWSDLASSRTVWDNFFWLLTMFVFERSKTLYFCVRVEFFSKTVSITFATHFCGTCPHTKKNELSTQRCFKKNKVHVDGGKNKIIFGWASRIWEDFLDRPFMQKTKKFRSFYILSRLGRSLKWNWLKQFSCRFASSLSKLRILERQIRGSQRNCFFFCCWLGIVSSFFCGWSVSLFIFFCHLKNNSGCIVEWKQKQQWDKFRVGKKLERKAKSFNMAD